MALYTKVAGVVVMAKQPGFSETAGAFETTGHVVNSLGADGRLMIPAAIRDAVGIQRGDKVRMRVENGRIVISGIKADWARIQGIAAHLKKPGESVVEEFLAERRAEAERE